MKNTIPEAALLQHIAILGKTGSGKTYAAKGVVESLLDDEVRVCIIDPTGAWSGLRSSVTGKSAGYPVVIFGGTHADLPLGAAHGEALAEIIGTSSTPAIIDTSQMKVGERTRFFADFADALIRKNRGPLHLIIDEAHLFAPQGKVNDPQSGAMLHAANNLVSLGRSRGLRIMLITQRPAKLHKDSLTQVETLVALRLIAPQDRKAVEEWIKDNADQDKGREIIQSLATLKTGQAWIWAPEIGVLERVAFPKIRTFDSSKAPEDSGDGKGPVLAPIDRETIAAKLQTVAADALANDPARLKARIRELETQHKKNGAAAAPVDVSTIEDRGYQRGLAAARHAQEALIASLRMSTQSALQQIFDGARPPHQPIASTPRASSAPVKTPVPTREKRTPTGDTSLSKAERRVLTALAQYPQGRSKSQVAVLTGYASNGGGFNNSISSLRTKGFIEGTGDRLEFTQEGLDALGDFEPLPEGEELLKHWLGQVSKAERAALESLAAVYPDALSKEELARRAGYEPNGGGFNNALSRLRTLELVSGRGELRASENLF